MRLQELWRAGRGGRGGLTPAASFSMPKRTCFVFCVALLASGTNAAEAFGGAAGGPACIPDIDTEVQLGRGSGKR